MMNKKIIIGTLVILGIIIVLLVLNMFEEKELSVSDYNYTVEGVVKQKGNRLLGISVTEGKIGFDKSFSVVQDAGIQFVELPLQWDEIETSTEKYENPYLKIANSYYSSRNIKVLLTINPIDTNTLHLPEDLKDKDFDDPMVIERYKKLIDYVFSQIPDPDLVAISIGNEVDIYLGSNQDKWNQYQEFFEGTSEYIRNKKPGIKVGCKLGDAIGEQKEEIKVLNQNSDVILANYYPINEDFSVRDPLVVQTYFDELTSVYKGKTIYITETGYPSSTFLQSSEAKQMEFVGEIFKAWDKHSSQIQLIDFVWLHDLSKSELDSMKEYYSISNNAFIEFLETLGLRTYGGRDKPAFVALKAEAKARGW